MAVPKEYLGKGWRFPVDVDRTGSISVARFEDSIRDSIFIILGTAIGERILRPTFGCGIHDLIFAPNNPTTCGLAQWHCEDALNKWEPRITKVEAKARPSPDEPNKILIDVSYQVIQNSAVRNLVYPFYLKTEEDKP
jgi:phage baseplate assembly protein W